MLPKVIKASSSKKRYLFDSVYSQTQLSTHYLLQLIFSTIITTLGLLTNNTVVVIGAMLISPLFWPVLGIALGIITTRKNILKNSAFSLFVSITIVLFVSSIITFMVPISEFSQEITTRINPNIIDLFIALATSVIGILALYYPTISATATGVAISISLLPPLTVAGIGIAKLSPSILGKSLLLFGTNTGAIVFTGVIVLYILKIRPKKQEEETRFKYGVAISALIMILLSLPLSFYLRESLNQNRIATEINNILSTEITSISKGARVENVDIDFLSLGENTPLNIDAVIYLPEGVLMTQSEKDDLISKLSTLTNSDINLNVNIISTISLQTEEDRYKSFLRKNIREIIYKEFEEFEHDAVIDDIQISFSGMKEDPNKEEVNIVISVKKFKEAPLNYKDLTDIKEFVEQKLSITANVEVEFIPVSKLNESELEPGIFRGVSESISAVVGEISDDIYLEDLSIKENVVVIKILVPAGIYIGTSQEDSIERSIEEIMGFDVELTIQLLRYELR